MAMRKFDPTLDPEMFTLKDTSLGKVNGILNNASKNCDVFAQVGKLVDTALGAIQQAIGAASDMISAQLKAALQGLNDIANGVFSKIESWFNQLWDESGLGGIKSTITNFLNAANAAIDSVMNTIEGMMNDMLGAVSAVVASTCGVVTGALQNLNASMVSQNPAMKALSSATDIAKKTGADIGEVAGGKSLLDSGVQTKVSGITSSIASVKSLYKVLPI